MKNYIALLFIVLFLTVNSFVKAQTGCGTRHHVDAEIEREYLEFRNNESEKLKSLRSMEQDIQIPIQFHVIRPSDGISDFEPRYTDSIIDILNLGFEDTPFQFYQCNEINYIDDDNYSTMCLPEYICGNVDYEAFHNFYNSDIAINVYLPERTIGLEASAWGHMPWSENHSYVATWNLSKVHVHEMGHCFGLLHTHTRGELVDGSNCMTAGDLCCDTPAEPSLDMANVNEDCEYVGTATDPNGDIYQPDVGNFMSYAPIRCCHFFTEDQVDRMVYFYDRYFKQYQCDENFKYTDISFAEITTDPYPAMENEPYSILVKLRNSGNATNVNSFYVHGDIEGVDIGRSWVGSVYPSNPGYAVFDDAEDFPHEPGRYKVCVNTLGDSLEIYDHNNSYCQEILIRQEAGIPDLQIRNLSLTVPFGERDTYNPINFDLENLGSITAENIYGRVYVNEELVDSFTLADMLVGERLTVELDVFLGDETFQEVCIEMNPAFTEERLDNNSVCTSIVVQDQILSDIAVDSLYIFPNDSLLIPYKPYKLYYRYVNNGPSPAWVNTSYLSINNSLHDSIAYPIQWGMGFNHTIDSFDFEVTPEMELSELCVLFDTYRDTIHHNNRLCLTKPVQTMANVLDQDFQKDVVVYPNPFMDMVTIKSDYTIESVKLYNALGAQVKTVNISGTKEVSIQLTDLPSGIYYISVDIERTKIFKSVLKIE